MAKPPFSEEVIIEKAWTTVKNAGPVTDALSTFGITKEMLTAFKKEIEAAEALPREIENRAQLKVKTRNKNAVLDSCINWSTHVKKRLEMAFGKKSPEALSFPTKQMREARTSETVMLGIFEMILGLTENYQDQLAPFGQTPEFVSEGKALYEKLRDANEAQEFKKKQNELATKSRQETFDAIYKTVNRINEAGRIVFRDDPVKSLLFKSPWPSRKGAGNDTNKHNPPAEPESTPD
jgi:hypothetical protein